jgi:hypothetical protein
MFKKADYYTRLPQARQDALLPGQGCTPGNTAGGTIPSPSPEPAETGSFPMVGYVEDFSLPGTPLDAFFYISH